MFDSRDFSDVVIAIGEDDEIAAHRFIIRKSPYFHQALSLPMQEGESRRIEIRASDDEPPAVVRAVVRYLYTDDVEDILSLVDGTAEEVET